MERGRRPSMASGHCRFGYSRFCNDKDSVADDKSPAYSGGVGFIEHRVSKLDTLAGIAIKYGVEVGDIKKMNGLATDLQIFALKSIKIPLPGRHPPSACLNSSQTLRQIDMSGSAPSIKAYDLLDSFQSLNLKSTPQKLYTAMSSLQGCYGLKPTDASALSEACETPLYGQPGIYQQNDAAFVKHSSVSSPPLGLRRKSRSVANGFLNENGGVAGSLLVGGSREVSADEKLVSRQSTPKMLLRGDNVSGGAFSATIGKGLALRSKAAGRRYLAADTEETGLSHAAPSPLDSFAAYGFSGVRKCSSASNLQDQDSNCMISIWPTTNWGFTTDLTRPILEPNPATAFAIILFPYLVQSRGGKREKYSHSCLNFHLPSLEKQLYFLVSLGEKIIIFS